MIILIFPLVILRVDMLADVVALHASIVAFLAVAGSTMLIEHGASMAVARRQPFAAAEAASQGMWFPWFADSHPMISHGSLQDLGILGQLRVTFNGWPILRRRRWIPLVVFLAAITAAMSYWMGMAAIAPASAAIGLTVFGAIPQGTHLHPLPRSRRATLVFAATLASMGLYCLVVGLLEAVLLRFHPFRQDVTIDLRYQPFGGTILPGLVLMFAWSPMLHWASSQPPLWNVAPPKVRGLVQLIVLPNLVFLPPFFISLAVFGGGSMPAGRSPWTVWAGMFAVALLVHTAFYLRLRRGYAVKDLV